MTKFKPILEVGTFVLLFALGLMGAYLVFKWDDLYTYWLMTRVAFIYGSICSIIVTAWLGWDDHYGEWAKAEKIFEHAIASAFICAVLFAIGMLIGVVANWFMRPPPGL